jgi:protein-S-isoprenylcysteine O-methyltransferase Ste14
MIRRLLEKGAGWVAVQMVLLGLLTWAGPAGKQAWTGAAWMVVGAAWMVAGVLIVAAGTKALRKNLTPLPLPRENAQLVRHGIYQYVRHPLYLAIACLALGWSLAWGSWRALIATIALCGFFDAKARYEEKWLARRFPEYEAYRRDVKRFVPGIY